MKKIGKLSINLEKVISNDELINLKGGYGGDTNCCTCWGWEGGLLGNMISDSWMCTVDCRNVYPNSYGAWTC